MTLNPIGNSTSLSYVFPNGFTVANGGTLAVSPNVSVVVAGGQTLTDAGTMSFSSGDVVTMEYEGCCGSESISVTGSLSSNGATFNNQGNGSITFGPTGTISGANNTYNLPVYVPYTDVTSLAGNTSFDQVLIAAGTLSSGTLALNPIGNSTSLSYAFPNGFTIANGGTLAVSANVLVDVPAGQTLTDAGTMSFSSGDVVTMEYSGAVISVSGSLSSNGATFNNGGGASITFGSTGTISGANNTYNVPVYVPYTDVASLAGNTSFDLIGINAGTLSSGTLTLNPIGNSSNFSFDFPNGFTVANGATLAVSANVSVIVSSGQTLTDAGTVTFSSGDVVTVDNGAHDRGQRQPEFTAARRLMVAAADANLTINSGGTLLANNETIFNLSNLTLNSGSTTTLTTDVLSGVFTINSNTTINIAGNDFSKLTTPNGLIAAGNPSATINVAGNYWGTNVAGIDAIIDDHNKNANLPTVNFQPFISYSSGTSANPATVTFSTDSQTFNLTASVTTTAGLVISEGTETFSVFNGTTQIGQTTSPVQVENGSATASYTLPAGTQAGLYTIVANYSGSANYLPSTDTSHFLTVTPASTTTTVNSASATFSGLSDQMVPLSAQVSSAGGAINEGIVTFTILSGGNPVGSPVTANVVNDAASANYDLLANTAGGSYTIQAVYSDPFDFATSTGTNTLSVAAASTSVTPADAATSFNAAAGEPVSLSANVSSAAGTINQGSVTFEVLNGSGTEIGSPISAPVVNGVASTNSTLPAGTPVGLDTIQAVFNGTASFATSGPSDSNLAISTGMTTTTASNVSKPVNNSGQTVMLTANVTSGGFAVNEGTVTFTIFNGSTPVGSPASGNVVSGTANASYTLPGSLGAGTYVIQAVYNGTADYAGSSDSSHTLTMTQPLAYQLIIHAEPPSNATAGQRIDFCRRSSFMRRTSTATSKPAITAP